MWNDGCGCFAVGTTDDGVTRNRILALDAQIWPLLALPGMAASRGTAVLATVDRRLRVGDGYSYSYAGHGLWTEGTAQVALLLGLLGQNEKAIALKLSLVGQRAPGGGFFATAESTVATGFASPTNPGTQLFYYHMQHLGAAAWVALAERGFNPFVAAGVIP
jgi:hypothetical protein